MDHQFTICYASNPIPLTRVHIISSDIVHDNVLPLLLQDIKRKRTTITALALSTTLRLRSAERG